ncbi:MAG: sulfatase [Pseudomonadota bacterium]
MLVQIQAPPGVRVLVHVYDLAQFCLCGLLCASVVAIWQRLGPWRRGTTGAALWIAFQVLGFMTLTLDLENFSRRTSGDSSHYLVLVPAVVLIASSAPLTWLVAGQWRPSWWRGVCFCAATTGFVANGLILPRDYPGGHLFLALACALALRASLMGLRLPGRIGTWPEILEVPGRRRAMLLAVAWVLLLCSVVVPPPGRVTTAWSRFDGAVLMPFVGRVHARIREQMSSSAVAHAYNSPWFQDRSRLAAIPARPYKAIPENPIVIFLTVEALRADVVNSRQYDAQIPTLARMRDTGLWFTAARTAGTKTIPSLAALFSGVYFSQQYWMPVAKDGTGRPNTVRGDEQVRFPELLQRANIRTLHAQSIAWLAPPSGLVRGFGEIFYISKPKKEYPALSRDVALHIMDKLREPVEGPLFLYAHWYDPHHPYKSSEVKGSAFERYIGEVGLIDQSLHTLVEFVRDRGLEERTFFIVSADHGEAFGEHKSQQHPGTLYEELLRVPLIISGPGVEPRVVTQAVSLIDLAPTVLEFFGQATPGHFMGESLVPFMFGETVALTRPIIAETMLKQSLVLDNGLKVIVDNHYGRTEAYDLDADPKELHNIVDSDERVHTPLELLRDFFIVHTLRKEGYTPPFFN